MSSNYDILTEQSKIFKNAVENIIIGAKSYQSSSSVEEKVLCLKQLNEFLYSKLQALNSELSIKDVSTVHTKELDTDMEKKLLDKIVDEKIRKKLLRTIYLGQIVKVLLNVDLPEELRMGIYKKKILEQYNILVNVSEALNKICTSQRNLLQETIALKIDLKVTQIEYKKKSIECKQKSAEEKDKLLGKDYKEQIQNTEKRIAKLNFMRVLTSRLLIFGIDWKEKKEFIPMLEKMRTPITMDTFKD